ncbi:unnamed protein product [Oppiella nova]|uniref:AMP-dependent synthetase/ligase domain-containing protein n=1 Tax=Oppiella nova TaxID=334625 RepID=A0A7R9QAV9_9ACAR|nr:unnamed protein product [Oppiella nova]CAG2162082.1 unnamed protein product [Oppiella nova]
MFSANSIEYVIGQFAVYLLGNTFSPVKPTNGVFELRNQLKDSGASVVFTSVANASIVEKILNDKSDDLVKKQIKLVIVLDGSYQPFNKIPHFDVKPNEDIFIIGYTSGTTGVPKVYGLTEYMTPVTGGLNGSVGLVGSNTEMKFIDLKTGQSLGPNLPGEICVRGCKLFAGYLNNEVQTKAAIDSNGWLHTGDIGYYDENNKIFITDRIKELIKYKSWHESDGQHPRAYVRVKDTKHVSQQELIEFVESMNLMDNIPELMSESKIRNMFPNRN